MTVANAQQNNQGVDITPSWSQVLPLLLILLKDGSTHESREFARQELTKMARVADLYVNRPGT